jgi:hypothetical protein
MRVTSSSPSSCAIKYFFFFSFVFSFSHPSHTSFLMMSSFRRVCGSRCCLIGLSGAAALRWNALHRRLQEAGREDLPAGPLHLHAELCAPPAAGRPLVQGPAREPRLHPRRRHDHLPVERVRARTHKRQIFHLSRYFFFLLLLMRADCKYNFVMHINNKRK